jgi:hypothetical protein
MRKAVEARSAGKRSLASGIVAVGTADLPEVAAAAHEIQTARLRARYDFSPAVAAVIASHAYAVADRWGRA